jgi:hypothetical protein
VGAAASTVAAGELGKLLNAIKDSNARGAFKNNGTAPGGVTLGSIPQAVITKLRSLSDAELSLLSELNTFLLSEGLNCGPGIAAV